MNKDRIAEPITTPTVAALLAERQKKAEAAKKDAAAGDTDAVLDLDKVLLAQTDDSSAASYISVSSSSVQALPAPAPAPATFDALLPRGIKK